MTAAPNIRSNWYTCRSLCYLQSLHLLDFLDPNSSSILASTSETGRSTISIEAMVDKASSRDHITLPDDNINDVKKLLTGEVYEWNFLPVYWEMVET